MNELDEQIFRLIIEYTDGQITLEHCIATLKQLLAKHGDNERARTAAPKSGRAALMAVFRLVRGWRRSERITEAGYTAFIDMWESLFEELRMHNKSAQPIQSQSVKPH